MVGLVFGSYAGCVLVKVLAEDGGDPLTAATRPQIVHVPPKVNPYSETVFSVNFTDIR